MLLASPYGIPDSNAGIGGTIRMNLESAVFFLIDPQHRREYYTRLLALLPRHLGGATAK